MVKRSLFFKGKLSVFILLMTGMLLAQPAWSAPSLTISSDSATPGQSVNIPVNFTNDGTIVSLQFDVQYDSSQLTTGTPTAGAALGGNGLASAEINVGKRRVVITPMTGNTVMASGQVVFLPFTISAVATTGEKILSISNVVMSNARATTVSPASPGNGTVTINSGTTNYILTTATTGTGSGTVDGAGVYSAGATATVTATAEPGSALTGWSGADATECASGSVVMDDDKSCTATFTLTSDLPDLIVSNLSFGVINITRKAGTNVMVTDSVLNRGATQASKFIVAYHLSTDMIYGNGDDVASASKRTVISLNPGASNAWPSTSVVIPKITPAGSYHLCAKADDDVSGTYSVTELNEDNNWKCTANTIRVPKADLVMSQVANFNLSVSTGRAIVVLNSLTNNGGSQALAFDIGYVLSSNFVIGDSDDIPLPTTQTLTSIGVGATSTASTHVTIPVSVAPGTYWVGAIADVNGVVDETKESNNTGRASNKVTVNP